jgi:hypothetical protein
LSAPRPVRDLLSTAAWTAFFLVAADLALGALFRMPDDASKPPAPLAQYFDFGTSIEGKLRRMVRDDDSTSAPVTRAGWLEPWNDGDAPVAAAPGGLLVAAYGQSFAFQVVGPMAGMDSAITLRTRGGPASPASHSYAFWTQDRRRLHADVAIFGVLASSVRAIDAATASTWQFEAPPPYTMPRYRVAPGGGLAVSEPEVRSLADLRAALADPVRFRAWEAQLSRDDAWYDPLLWRASWVDRVTLARVLRRAWAQRAQREKLARVHDRAGFRESAEQVRVLRALVGSFASGCRADGTLPVVLLLEDAGYSDHLGRLLGPHLDSLGVTWLATHEVADAGNPVNFKADGHFVPEVNARIAAALLQRIRAGLARSGGGTEGRAAPPGAGPDLAGAKSPK